MNEYKRGYTKKQAHLAVVGTDIAEPADQHNHLIDATHTVLRLEVKPCGEPGTMQPAATTHRHGTQLGQGFREFS